MDILKKINILLLTSIICILSIFAVSTKSIYAQNSYIKKLSYNKVYKYDIDGNGKKDFIKIYRSNKKLLLKVNNCINTLTSNYNSDFDYDVKIYNFNKNDNSLDIVMSWSKYDEYGTKILKFKNSLCKVNKNYKYANIYTYNPNTGIVTFEEDDFGRYKNFINSIGSFRCYTQVKVNNFSLKDKYTANTTRDEKTNLYVAAKNLTAYTSTNSSKKAFIVKKNNTVNIYALYQNNNKRYIKVKNKSGKYGYIKVKNNLLFTEDSCLHTS